MQQIFHLFRLTARKQNVGDKKYHISTFCQSPSQWCTLWANLLLVVHERKISCEQGACEPGSLRLTLAHSCSLFISGSLCHCHSHSLRLTRAHSDSVSLSVALSLALWGPHWLTRPLLGLLRRSCVAPVYPALALTLKTHCFPYQEIWQALKSACIILSSARVGSYHLVVGSHWKHISPLSNLTGAKTAKMAQVYLV